MTNKFRKGYLQQYGALLVLFLAVCDLLIIATLFLFIMRINHINYDKPELLTLCFSVLLFISIAAANSFYRSYRTTSIIKEVCHLILIWALTITSLSALLYVFDTLLTIEATVFTVWIIVTPIMLILLRVTIRYITYKLRVNGRNFRLVAIIGATDMGLSIANTIDKNDWMGLKLKGIYDDRNFNRLNQIYSSTNFQIKDITSLFSKIKDNEIDIVYLALPMKAQQRIKELIDRLTNTSVSIYYAPDFDSFDLFNAKWESLEGQPVISIVETPFLGSSNIVKKLEDMVIITLAILVFAMPMLIVAILIKLTSSGSIFYRQNRYGLDGKIFTVWKFRTMHQSSKNQIFTQATVNDIRVTALGKFLRKYSIDELPQLFNVIQGNMSVIGPRPHPIALDEEHQQLIKRYNLRFKVKPGITGWAQVNGYRGETDTLDKMQGRIKYDLEYITNWSIFFDFRILMLTIISVLKPVNAY